MNSKDRLRRWAPLVISCIALFVAISGPAIGLPGKNTVSSNDIKPEAVKTTDISHGAVGTGQIAGQAITGEKIKPAAITSEDIEDGTITGDDIQGQTVTRFEIKDGSIPYYKLQGITFARDGAFYGNHAEAEAKCPEGTQLIGGGAGTEDRGDQGSGRIIQSVPNFQDKINLSPPPNGWYAEAANNGGLGHLVAYAICLK